MTNHDFSRIQKRLNQVEASFSRLLNHLPGVAYRCSVDPNFNYRLDFVSKRCESILGLSVDELCGEQTNIIERMMPTDDLSPVRSAIREAIRNKASYDIYYRAILPSGETRWLWDKGEGVFDENAKCTHLEGIMMDVTEQKEKEISLRNENNQLRSSIKNSYGLGQIIGQSAPMQELYNLLLKASQMDSTVMLYGETGVGKDLAAQTIHELANPKGRYVPVNCGAIPEQLLESEFFGHVKGAFSGATSNRPGYLAAANGGTLFLDEVGELPLKLQVKLLRALESKSYSPVGSNEIKHSNFRLISATNRDLKQMVHERAMREDFFYRIHVLTITIPPLRERHGDISLLIDAYLRQRGVQSIIPPTVRLTMEEYGWPGNIRELQNALERFLAFGDTGINIGGPYDGYVCMPIEQHRQMEEELNSREGSLRLSREEVEKKRINAVLQKCNGKKSLAAQELGITLRTLQRKCKQYAL